MNNERFVNPYNFIKLPNKKAKAYDDKQDLYGVIHYTLTTKTPLFIPNSSNDKAFSESKQINDHKSYDFYSYTDLTNVDSCEGKYHEPVIPGSEIRGVVRNVYETLTDSCMSQLNEDVHPVKRTMAAFKPGLLCLDSNGKISLVKAKSVMINDDMNSNQKKREESPYQKKREEFPYRNGDKVYFKANLDQTLSKTEHYSKERRTPNDSCGYVLKWGMSIRKYYYHAYVKASDSIINNIDGSTLTRSIKQLVESYCEQPNVNSTYKDDSIRYKEYLDDLKSFLKKEKSKYFPINYSKVDNIVYYSPAVFTKEISNNSIGNLSGAFVPCSDDEFLCPTCSLFGMVGSDGSKGSHIRFSDGRVKFNLPLEDYYEIDKVTISNLNGPKLGNVDFYLKKPDGASFGTYDYFIKGGHPKLSPGEIRGRKYYWHHNPSNVRLKNNPPLNLNKTIRPVKKEILFTGDLYFDGISKKQLEQLIWILNSGKEGLGLKLGMGKPLGLGSVTFKVDSVEERKVTIKNNSINYELEEVDDLFVSYDEAGLSKTPEKEIKKIAKLDVIPSGLKISYPYTTPQPDNGFEWFLGNHKTERMARCREDMNIKYELPNILDNDVSLPCFENSKKQGGFQKSGNNNGSSGNNKNYNRNFNGGGKKNYNNNYRGKKY